MGEPPADGQLGKGGGGGGGGRRLGQEKRDKKKEQTPTSYTITLVLLKMQD